MDCVRNRSVDDEQVKAETPVFDIPDIAEYASFHVFQILGFAPVARHLAPSRDSRLHEVAHHVFVDQFRIFFRVFQHVRARSHHAHVAFQHIDELRQLVDVRFPHDVSPFCLSRVVLCGLQRVGLRVHLHASELVAVEFLIVEPVPFLLEEDRSRHGYFRYDCHDDEDDGEERAEEQQREHDVERPFQHLVSEAAQRISPQAEVGHVAYHVEVHAVVQVVVYVRHAVEVNHVVFAVVDD